MNYGYNPQYSGFRPQPFSYAAPRIPQAPSGYSAMQKYAMEKGRMASEDSATLGMLRDAGMSDADIESEFPGLMSDAKPGLVGGFGQMLNAKNAMRDRFVSGATGAVSSGLKSLGSSL